MRVPLSGLSRRGREHGAAAIIVALTTTVVIGFLAFVTDFGMAYSNKRGLQTGADAAALAVAQEIALQSETAATCTEMAAAWQGPGKPIADDYLARNQVSADAAVSGFDLSCSPSGGLVVAVDTAQESPSFFGGIAGADGIDLTQTARAVVGPAGVPTGLRPIGVCKVAAAAMAAAPDVSFAYALNKGSSGCGSASGNWGMVGFGECLNTPDSVAGFLNNGYTGPVDMSPATECGNPGMDSSSVVRTAYDNILDKEVFLPVYDLMQDNGNTATMRIVSFIAVKVCAWRGTGSQGKQGLCYDPAKPIDKTSFQFRYIRAVPVADLALCTPGDVTCDFGLRVVKLVE